MSRELTFGGSPRLMTAIVGIALLAVGWIIYASPGEANRATTATKIRVVTTMMPRRGSTAVPTHKRPVPTGKTIGVTSVQVHRGPSTVTTKTVPYAHKTYVYARLPGSNKTTAITVAAAQTCASFRWQQDAQAAYLNNLSDPLGLDGPVGPDNGDGIACSSRPVDPSRPKSKPMDAFTWPAPVVPTKAQVLDPSQKYLGLAADGLPGDQGLYDQEDVKAGQAPSMVEWFQYFDQRYPAAKVTAAWQRGALPVITWMTAPSDYRTPGLDISAYSLTSIADGSQDGYIKAWAANIAEQKMPVVIRWDHESNGNWYPWSVGWPAGKNNIWGNSPGAYATAWKHVWQIFRDYGANKYAIWAYVPSRVDTLPAQTWTTPQGVRTTVSQPDIVSSSYPGDGYVDWVGMDGYQFDDAESTTYTDTFAQTLALLRQTASKPILVAEMGSADRSGTAVKSQWITQTLAGLGSAPDVIGAIYFDNDVSGAHTVNHVSVRTNWKFDTSAASLAAFRAGAASGAWATGVFPPYLLGQ